MGNVAEGGVMAAVILLAVRVALPGLPDVVPKVEQGALDAVIPTKPAGKDAAPVFTHHPYIAGVVAPKPPDAL
jgi:hypothetical protein